MKKRLPFFESISIIVVTIIGAGILGVPYVFAQGNFYTSLVILVIVTFLMVTTKLFLGEIALRTNGYHQVVGYIEKYLGVWAKRLKAFVLIFGVYGALLAYTIGQGEVLTAIFGGTKLFWTLLFYIVFSWLLYKGISIIKNIEFILTMIIFLILLIIGFMTAGDINLSYLSGWRIDSLLTAYGVILFACAGVLSIPHAREILGRSGKSSQLFRAIAIGATIPSIIYLFFAVFVVGVTGSQTTQIATIGLGGVLGPSILIIGSVLAFFTMATSFISMGLALRGVYQYDFKLSPSFSNSLVIAVPLILYFTTNQNFISILSFVGAIGSGLSGILIVLAFWQAKRKGLRHPEFTIPKSFAYPASVIILIMYSAGIILTIFK